MKLPSATRSRRSSTLIWRPEPTREAFEAGLRGSAAVVEAVHATGDHDYLVRLRCSGHRRPARRPYAVSRPNSEPQRTVTRLVLHHTVPGRPRLPPAGDALAGHRQHSRLPAPQARSLAEVRLLTVEADAFDTRNNASVDERARDLAEQGFVWVRERLLEAAEACRVARTLIDARCSVDGVASFEIVGDFVLPAAGRAR